MIEEFLGMVSPDIHERSGKVFYSGRTAFSSPSKLYVLGLNPGGNPVQQAHETIAQDIQRALSAFPEKWSAYVDESWLGRKPGTKVLQRRVTYLLGQLGLHPRLVPASNVVFVRSARESDLRAEKQQLLRLCWPVHEAVISRLGVRVVLCMGSTAGEWVRDSLGAHHLVDSFIEENERRWRSCAHVNSKGQRVLTLTHPSIADWTTPSTDPTALVLRSLMHGI